MKRDMELIRLILQEVERAQTFDEDLNINLDGYSKKEVDYHVILLNEAGLIVTYDESTLAGIRLIPLRLTWQGHEFLEATKNTDAWSKTKEIMVKSGGFVFEVAKSILITYITQQLTGQH
jgi:hypothetical protein